MADRLHIYGGEPITRLLGFAGAQNRSGRLNDVAARYLGVVADEITRLRFSRAEWLAILDANNGGTMAGIGDEIAWRATWANVADSRDLGEKWGVDTDAIVQRLRGLSLAAKMAVAEVIERFWERCDMDTDAALAAVGVMLDAD